MDKKNIELIAELNEALDRLERGDAPSRVVEALENRIQAIMDQEVEKNEWLNVAANVCYGGL